ncbi:MAG: zf-HC2 domain-containing protein [Armatimonadetes bacterium]|nr:zf-HC2 domain-containing protein [Armatimonadota bacterium]
MNCDEIRGGLALYSGGELAPDFTRRVEAHLRECPECRSEYERLRAFESRLKASMDAPGLPDVTDAVMSRIPAQVSRPRRLVWALGFGTFAVAACLVMLIWGWGYLTPDKAKNAPQTQVTERSGVINKTWKAPAAERRNTKDKKRQLTHVAAYGGHMRSKASRLTSSKKLKPIEEPSARPLDMVMYRSSTGLTREMVVYVNGEQVMRVREIEARTLTPPDPDAATIQRPPLKMTSI